VHEFLLSILPLDAAYRRSWVGLASAALVPPAGVWPRRGFRIVVPCFARQRCGLHTWKTVRAIRILYNTYQLSAVGERSTAPDLLVWNTPAFGVLSHAEIIVVKCDDGD
jgi:hypothetical protein